MAITNLLGFDSVAEVATPAVPTKTLTWSNPGNANTSSDATYAEVLETTHLGSTKYSYWLRYTAPTAGAGVPVGSTITNIYIRVRADADLPGIASASLRDAVIEGGTDQANPGIDEVIEWHEFDGNLAYWGIDNTEALAFLHDTGGAFKFYAALINSGGPTDTAVRVYNAECRITFDPPARNRRHVS